MAESGLSLLLVVVVVCNSSTCMYVVMHTAHSFFPFLPRFSNCKTELLLLGFFCILLCLIPVSWDIFVTREGKKEKTSWEKRTTREYYMYQPRRILCTCVTMRPQTFLSRHSTSKNSRHTHFVHVSCFNPPELEKTAVPQGGVRGALKRSPGENDVE